MGGKRPKADQPSGATDPSTAARKAAAEPDDVWSAPESGQPPGGRDSEPEGAEWPPVRPTPKDEL